jgi:hypothetical protein
MFCFFSGISQTYTITGSVNSSSYTCSTFAGYNTIRIGDGSTSTSLTMNADLNLISTCSLGPLRIIIDNARIDFSTANNILRLPEGSSIEFINGGSLFPNGGNGGGCTGNDRIYIGVQNIASCQGASGISGFDELNSFGGTGSVRSNSPVCFGSSINLFATPPPIGTFTYLWTGPNGFSNTNQNPLSFPAISGSGGNYSVVMTRSDDKKAYGQVTVVVNQAPTTAIAGSNQSQCNTSSFTLSGNAPTIGTGSWSVVVGTATITTAALRTSLVTGVAAGTSATLQWTITNGTCTSSSDVILTNNALPTINGTLNVCPGSTTTLTGSGTADATTPWTSGTPSFATVSNSGVVSGVASGTSVITYKNNNGCTITATVTVNALPNNTTDGFTGGNICNGSPGTLTFNPDNTDFRGPYTIVYTDGTTNWTAKIQTAALTTFNVAVNPIITTNYVLISITNAVGCVRTVDLGNTTARITVNPTPTLTGAVQAASVCVGSGATINLTGLLASRTSTVTYTIDGVAQTAVTGVVANASGVGSFTSAVLTTANNGQTLRVTGVTTTSSTSNCPATFTRDVTLSVNPNPTTSTVGNTQNLCGTLTSTSLGGNTPTVGTGQWTQTSGSGTSTFSASTSGTSTAIATVIGTYVYKWTISNGTCTPSTAEVTVNFYATPPAPSVTVVNNCDGTSTLTASGYTGTLLWSTNATTASINVNIAATYTVTQTVNGCTSLNGSGIAAPKTTPVAPEFTQVNPSCLVATGSVSVTSAVSGSTYTLTGITPAVAAKSGTSFAGLATGSYELKVQNAAGCISSPPSIIIIAIVVKTNIWKAGIWSLGILPSSLNDIIVFADDYSENEDVNGCSCSVSTGKNVTIKSGKTMKIVNGVSVLGTLTFENNASLVQINDDAVNTGNINYKRHTTKVKRYDYTYWSSPVEGQTLKALSPNTLFDKYYGYNNGWVLYYNGAKTMKVGEGYIIRAPQTFSITNATIDTAPQFVGVPNNGVKEVVIGPSGDYLLGNPYPSAIDADAFLSANTGTTGALQGTLYFWTHNSPPSSAVAGDATYNYTGNDYAPYNLTGGTATAKVDADKNDPNDNNNFSLPTGKIAAGQAFFAPSSVTGGTVKFDNSMRQRNDAAIDNSRFFKMSDSKGKSTNAIQKNRVWLNLTNGQGAFKQTLVGYITGATNGNEGLFDGESYDGNQFVDFYSVNNGKNLTIQGRALPFDEMDTVPLGYSSSIAGSFAIGIDKVDGVLVSQAVFIEDKDAKIIHNLKEGPYNFTTQKGVFNNRFVLRYTNTNKTLAKEDFELLEKGVVISNKNKEIKIQSKVELIDKVMVYDVSGKLVQEKKKIENMELILSGINAPEQVFIVKVFLINGTMVSKKIIY